MPLIVCFSMTVLRGGGRQKKNNIFFFPPYMEHPRPYIIAKTSTMAELLRSCITFRGHFFAMEKNIKRSLFVSAFNGMGK